MRYSNILKMDIVNGVGIACSIFFQGCPYHLGISRQAVWAFCHKPYMETLDLKLRTIKSVADIQGVDLTSLTKKIIELDNDINIK